MAPDPTRVCRIPTSWPGEYAGVLPPLVSGLTVHAILSDGTQQSLVPAVGARADDVLVIRATHSDADAIEVRLPLHDTERILGFGEQFGELDQRGRTIDAWVEDLLATGPRGTYYMAPLAYSSRGFALLVDTFSRFSADVGDTRSDELRWRVPGNSIEAFVLLGTPKTIMGRVVELTGAPLLPPAWAFGVWSSARSGTEAVFAEADRMRAADLPCSAIWVDDPWVDEHNFGCGASGTYPKGDYPDLRRLADGLHARGFKALGYLNCELYRDTTWEKEALARGFAVRDAAGEVQRFEFFHPEHQPAGMLVFEPDCASVVDFTDPEAVAWWQEKVRRLLVEEDWDGWMQDFGEQVVPTALMADGTTGEASHNRYPLLYHQATDAERLRSKPDSLFFVRAGYLGVQAVAPVVWGGDQGMDWSRERGLPSLLPAAISIGLSGVSTWGPDIVGLVELPEPGELPESEDKGVMEAWLAVAERPGERGLDKELWLRWLELGALSPVMRIHLGFKPRAGQPIDLWTDEETVSAFRRYARLHVQLFPYLFALAHEATQTGVPILRGLFVEFPEDQRCWQVDDQFLLGPSLLVAPVLVRAATTRSVYLPEGGWRHLWSGELFCGPAVVEIDAPIGQIPLFQRAGSVVPVLPEAAIPQTIATDEWAHCAHDVELWVTTGGPALVRLADGTECTLQGSSVEISSGGRHAAARRTTVVVDGSERAALTGKGVARWD